MKILKLSGLVTLFLVTIGTIGAFARPATTSVVARLAGDRPLSSAALGELGQVERTFKGDRLAVVRLAPGVSLADGMARLRRLPGIVAVSPNYPTAAASTPDDPFYPYEWNQTVLDYDQARNWVRPAPGTVIALLDTGVAYRQYFDDQTHVEFRPSPDLGRVEFVPGYDFVDNDPYPLDENQHGTHLASVIASVVDDAYGIAGFVDTIGIEPVRVLGIDGTGTLADLVAGIDYAVTTHVDVINLSLTVDTASSDDLEVLRLALQSAVDSGIVLVGAAGNDNGEVAWPAAYPPVIAVGAVRWNGCASSVSAAVKTAVYSAWGPQLDLMAPGGDNAMDLDHDGYPDGILGMTFAPDDPTSFDLWFRTGTSVAAAEVSAIAAVVRSHGVPGWDVPDLLAATAIDLGKPGFDVQTGDGLVAPSQAFAIAAVGWSEVGRAQVEIDVVPDGNHWRADLTVTNSATGEPAPGVTVWGHWTATGRANDYASVVSDADGHASIASRPNGGTATYVVDHAEVGGAGFIGSITPGGARFSRSLGAIRMSTIEPTGREPGCGGRN